MQGIPSPGSWSVSKDRLAITVLYLTMFLVVAGFGIILPFLPFYAKQLGANGFQMGLLITMYAVGQLVASPFWGRLSDRIGRKPVLIAGLVGFALSFYMMALAESILILMVVRTLGGFLSASALPTAQAYLVDLTTREQRGYAMSYMSAAANLGFLLGPVLGSAFSFFGLQAVFILGGTLILLTALLGKVLFPATVSTRPRTELHQVDPGIYSAALVGRDSVLYWMTMLVSFAASTLFSILGYYMIDRYQALSNQTALVYTIMGGVSALVQVFIVGKTLKRFGEDLVILLALALGVMGFIGLVYADDLTALYFSIVVISASLALSRPGLIVALSTRTHLEQGLTMGLQGSFDSFGRVIGPLWAGWVYGLAIAAPYWSAALVFVLAAGLLLLAQTARSDAILANSGQ